MTSVLDQQKILNPDLYADEEEDSPQDQGNNPAQGYDFDVQDLNQDHQDAEDQVPVMSTEERERLSNELLFCVQGIGSVKVVGGFKAYVKNEHCDESIRELIKHIKFESPKNPVVKELLGEWDIVQQHLLPLVIFHAKDKKLSFLTLMLLVQLTELPSSECLAKTRHSVFESLAKSKEAFLAPKVIETLMTHLSDCLQIEQKNQKHTQMIELVVVLFKQLLIIPERTSHAQNQTAFNPSAQKKLLLAFAEESVLDSFNYLSQEFTEPLHKKLAMHFLEIQYQIFKNFTALQIINPQQATANCYKSVDATQKARLQQRVFAKSMRHAKFGTMLQVTRSDGSSAMINNIYQTQIERNAPVRNQKRAPKGGNRKTNQENSVTVAKQIVEDGAKDHLDVKLLEVLNNYLVDMITNSYAPLVEELFNQMLPEQALLEESDCFHFFKLQTFMLQVCRIKAQMEHRREEAQADEEARKSAVAKGQAAKSVKKPKVAFKIDISSIGVSLQFGSFDFMLSALIRKMGKHPSTKPVSDKEFHAALQCLAEVLRVIKDMAACVGPTEDDEKNRKNAHLLKGYIFRQDICKICSFAYQLYKPARHNHQLLEDIVGFTHLFLEMLEEFSKGKIIKIQTQNKRKVKKSKAKKLRQNEDELSDQPEPDADFNPENPNDLEQENKQNSQQNQAQEEESELEDAEMDEESEEERHVERQFNFYGEISVLVEYTVVSRLTEIIKHPILGKDADLLQMVSSFFRRIVYQLKCTWIFYQLEYLQVFETFLLEGKSNNQLLGNLKPTTTTTFSGRKLEVSKAKLGEVLELIVGKFVALQMQNPLLAIEALFRYGSKETKDQILGNYFISEEAKEKQPVTNQANEIDQNIIFQDEEAYMPASDAEQEKVPEVDEKLLWKQEQDQILIDNYDSFKGLGKRHCFELLAELIVNKTSRQCYDRAKKLKLKKGTEVAKEQSTKLLSREAEAVKDCRVGLALKKMCQSRLAEAGSLSRESLQQMCDYVTTISEEHAVFLDHKEKSVLFGREADMADLRRAQLELRIVPVTKEQFEMVASPSFVLFLSALGVHSDQKGFLRMKSTVSKQDLERVVKQLHEVALPKILSEASAGSDQIEGPLLANVQMRVVQKKQSNQDKEQA